jgi:hypothetical protein
MKQTIFCLAILCMAASCHQSERDKVFEVKEFSSPAADSCAEPFLFTDKNEIVYLSWIEKKNKKSSLNFSTLSGGKWTEPVTIATGNNWFVNWADYPVLISDGNQQLVAHYLEKSGVSTYAYDVKYKTSPDNGKTWRDAKILHDDGKQAEHGFVSMMPYNGKFFVSWLDGRNTGMEEVAGGHEEHHGQMSLRGAIMDKQGNKMDEWELDSRVCDCCQTSAALTTNGPVVVYRDRSDSEIRDMSIVRFVNGQWTSPQTIFPDQWKITGCPVNGPRADAIENNLAIAWFSMQENKAQVKIIFSDDGGATFKKPIQVDEGKPIGRVDVVMLNEKTAMISWMEGSIIKALKVNSDGTKGKPIIIAASSDSRSSGFPQMTKAGNSLIFAWTDSKSKQIKLASMFF